MHFWIDKRSQSCGFGRARVAASLSGTGIGFGHHPRRMGGKSMLTPIHRYPAVDCRPHRPHRETSHQNHRHVEQHADLIQPSCRDNIRSQNQYRAQNPIHLQPQPSLQTHHQSHHLSDCHPIGQYGPSHSLELEQGTLGVGPIVARNAQNSRSGPDSQLLPSHLKCGMWASLALATVFVAVFQGTGLEFLIFCGFCATLFLLACIISMCNRPRELLIVPPVQSPAAIEARIEIPQNIVTVDVSPEPAALPPPYHIAILLPENSKQPEESPPPAYDKCIFTISILKMVLTSSLLGAAAGTGLALLVAMTIVVYRYYVVRRKGREWAELDRWEEEKIARKIKYRECNVIREPHAIQPVSSVPAHTVNTELLRGPLEVTPSPLHSYLHHQSKSFPPRLQRTPSVSSQSSLDSAPSRQSGHRGSSPQIRAYGPDGRTTMPSEHTGLQCPRSPSPMRAVSLDARCSSPASDTDIRTTSPSQSSLASLASGSACGSSICLSPKLGRCLSPLLIPPRTPAGIDPGCGPASPLGALQPDLYQRPDGPIYLTAPDNSVALGKLHLRVKYDSHLFDLTVHLIEAHNLCPIEEGGFRDPYVRLQLEPEVDSRKRQTAIHRGEAHPYFDQNFKFPVSRDQLQGKELILQVLDYDRYSHNDIIGEVRISIDDLDLSKSVEIWGDLLRMKKPPEDRPELLISLTYLPQAERLTFNIMKAKNLNTHHEPWVRIYHIVNGKRVKKRKTATLKFDDVQNPLWNESYSFNMPHSIIQSTAFEIYLVTSGGESNAISCGIGPEETGSGKQHWIDILHNPRKPIACWHFLR